MDVSSSSKLTTLSPPLRSVLMRKFGGSVYNKRLDIFKRLRQSSQYAV